MGYTMPDGFTGDVLYEVYMERQRQEALKETGKFFWTCADPNQSGVRKLAVLGKEFGKITYEVAERMGLEDRHPGHEAQQLWLYEALIQAAAVAVAWAESLAK
jgi:hypothetical protein